MVGCDADAKGAIKIDFSGNDMYFYAACGKTPGFREISFKRPKFMEACRMKLCRHFLG